MNNVINFPTNRKLTELTVIPDVSHELTISPEKTTALAIREQVGNVLKFKNEQLLKDENKAYDISYGIAKILNLPVGKLLSLRNEHDNIINGITDDYNLQKVA